MTGKCFSGKQPVFVVRQVPDGFDHQFFYDKEVVAVDGAYRKCTTAMMVVFTRPQEKVNATEWRISTSNIVVLEPQTLPISERKPIDDFPEVKAAIAAGAKEMALVGYEPSPALDALLLADNGKVTISIFNNKE